MRIKGDAARGPTPAPRVPTRRANVEVEDVSPRRRDVAAGGVAVPGFGEWDERSSISTTALRHRHPQVLGG